MREVNTQSHTGFKYGIVALWLSLGLVLGMFLFVYFTNSLLSYSLSLVVGILVFVIGIISILGLLKSIKGLREPNTFKKIIGLILNVGFVILFISVFVGNINDMFKAFN